MTQEQNTFIERIGKVASIDMTKSGILASLTIAQAILESGWGKSGLTVNANALFGIKATSSWKGKVYNTNTKECYDGVTYTTIEACFRAYNSWDESIADHSAFLTGLSRYAAVVGEKDYKKACKAIKAAGYATAPDYAEVLVKLIEQYSLTDYDVVQATGGKKMKLYLSPSNQPANKYIVGNTTEKIQMELVAEKVKSVLDKNYNIDTVMATLSMGIGSNERPQEAKNYNCDFYLAIHSNATGSTPPCSAAGAVGFYHPNGNKGKELMTAMVKELNAVCPVKSNRVTSVMSGMTQFNGQGYGEIRSPMQKGIPSALIEVDFHDNKTTAQWIIDNKDTIADAIVKSIVSTFDISKKNSSTATTSTNTSIKVGDIVQFTGGKVYISASAQTAACTRPASRCKVTHIYNDVHPYHLISEDGKSIYGWVDKLNVTK